MRNESASLNRIDDHTFITAALQLEVERHPVVACRFHADQHGGGTAERDEELFFEPVNARAIIGKHDDASEIAARSGYGGGGMGAGRRQKAEGRRQENGPNCKLLLSAYCLLLTA
jgi:hypothetical protein